MYLCIDVGGTKTIVSLINRQGKILHSVKFATMLDQDDFYRMLLQQIRTNFTTHNLIAIGVALPGVVKNNKAIWYGNLPWKKFDLAKLLKSDFNAPVFIENDANLAALAEAHRLSGRSMYLTFSTGIGGGIVENHTLANRYLDFEPGHTEYVYGSHKLEWEDIASAKAINALTGRLASEITDKSDWKEVAKRITIGLAPLITSLKPDRIIFGGPIGFKLDEYRYYLRRFLTKELPPKTKLPRFYSAKYQNLSVINGCYLYVKDQLK